MSQDHERRMHRVLDHIHDHPAGDLSLDALADVAAMSRFHWHRVFRAVVGETAAQAVRRVRLHRASVALVHGTDPLERVARTVGYPNAASFARAFTEAYGMSPTAFRNRGDLRPFPPTRIPQVMTMYPMQSGTNPPAGWPLPLIPAPITKSAAPFRNSRPPWPRAVCSPMRAR